MLLNLRRFAPRDLFPELATDLANLLEDVDAAGAVLIQCSNLNLWSNMKKSRRSFYSDVFYALNQLEHHGWPNCLRPSVDYPGS